MKGKIKVLSLLLALAMVASMFVACKDKPAPSSEGSSSAPAKREDVNLIWYHWGDKPKQPDAVIAELNKMSKEAIQTTVDFRFATGDDQKLKTIMSTGGEFDIAFTCAWFANYVVAAQNNQLADLTEKLPKVAPKLWEYIPENCWAGARVNGKIYAVPTYKDSAAAQYWTVHKEYVIDGAKADAELKAAGKKLSTVTPLLEKVKKYHDESKKAYPHDLTAPMNYNWAGLNGLGNGWDDFGLSNIRMGINLTAGNTKVISQYDDPDYVADLKTIKSWYDNGLVNKGASEVEKEFEFQVVGTGQGWDGCEAIWGSGKDYTIQMVKKYGPIYTTGSIQGSMNGISPNSKKIDRALQYIEYMNTNKDYRNTLGYGIKGTNWKLNDQGQVENLTKDAWQPGMFAQASFFELYPLKPAPANMYTNLKAVNDSAEASPLVGYVPVVKDLQTEIAACQAVIDKQYKYLQTGNIKDVDATVNKLKADLKAAGMDKIIAEIQKQVDEFLKAK
ncbi:ABC transporter substrate-binding protein [Paludicola sp. MB14-C6]|uniref:ABC transporter substrate-binding protein n=1 Tax=Paludihabitans sp. MB14-C6 TaxID=3070656 RepID=UPI0027DB140B|nr:ABC transporter substrate-binding protein [Paludicola sp. MB14-C6]WMJ22749.1 ABC transporter substrate-binding protein [Paludicola sp. MB14-C6]